MQTLGCPAHVHPTSCRQCSPSQPSPLCVSASSQVSCPRMKPSPQIGTQLLGVPTQLKPGSTWHVNEQPSPLVGLPSSHASPPEQAITADRRAGARYAGTEPAGLDLAD